MPAYTSYPRARFLILSRSKPFVPGITIFDLKTLTIPRMYNVEKKSANTGNAENTLLKKKNRSAYL